MQLVDDNCVLFPRQLEFHWVELPIPPGSNTNDNAHDRVKNTTENFAPAQDKVSDETETDATNETNATNENNATNETAKKVKREVDDEDESEPKIQHDENGTAITGEFTDDN